MNRLIVCLTVVATLSLVIDTAAAGHGRRIRVSRVVHHAVHHRVHHRHVVHRAPVVHHHRHAVRVAPARQIHHLQHSYRQAFVLPSHGHGVVHQFGHSRGGITISGRAFSVRIGF